MNYTEKRGLLAVGVVAGVLLAALLGWIGLQSLQADGGPRPIAGEEPTFGGSGQESSFLQMFTAGYTHGGSPCFATSTTAAVGTLPSMNPETNCVDYTVNQADVTLTLAASTSPWYPQRRNEARLLYIRNASTTATADIVIAAGTGINLKGSATTTSGFTLKTITGDTGADNYGRIEFVRQADGDLDAFLEVFTD